MKISWIGGWAIPSSYLKNVIEDAFSNFQHHCQHPHPHVFEEIEAFQPDIIIAYSLGATLFLNEPSLRIKPKIILLAPFICTQISITQLKFTHRWLNRDPLAAINDFYNRANLLIPKASALPYSRNHLLWGLDTLINFTPYNTATPNIIVGQNDPLININELTKTFPQALVIPHTDHNFNNLIKHLHL